MFQNPNVIIPSVVGAIALTEVKLLLDGKLGMRPIIGGFIVGAGLLIMSMFMTEIAVALSLMILLGSILNNGVPVLEKVMNMAS